MVMNSPSVCTQSVPQANRDILPNEDGNCSWKDPGCNWGAD